MEKNHALGRKLLITGGGGFVGARLARTLLQRGQLAGAQIDALVLAECFAANSVKRDVEKSSFYENKAMSMLGLNAQAGAALAPKLGAPGGA